MQLCPVQRNTSPPMPASPETAALKGKRIDRLPLSEESWEQSQAYQAVDQRLPVLQLPSEDSLANQLEQGRLIVDISLVSEDLCPQASQVFTRQREKKIKHS